MDGLGLVLKGGGRRGQVHVGGGVTPEFVLGFRRTPNPYGTVARSGSGRLLSPVTGNVLMYPADGPVMIIASRGQGDPREVEPSLPRFAKVFGGCCCC